MSEQDPQLGSDNDTTQLTERQIRVLEFLREQIELRGYPPSMREVGTAVGLTSTSSVSHQLRALESMGYIRRDPHRPRALEVRLPDASRIRRSAADRDDTGDGDLRPEASYVPVVGRIAAGGPILAEEHVEDVFPLPKSFVGEGTFFLLEVKGDSMVDAAICDGDYVVVRQQDTAENGQIVAALLDGEATVKTLQRTLPAHNDNYDQDFHQGNGSQGEFQAPQRHQSTVWLLPHNPQYEAIDGSFATILGRVTAVLRSL